MNKLDREILIEDIFCVCLGLIPVVFFVTCVVGIVHALLFR